MGWAGAGSQHGSCGCEGYVMMLVRYRERTLAIRVEVRPPATIGRWVGSRHQQWSVISHTVSVRPSSCVSSGRAGRSPSIIIVMTSGVLELPNGYPPVKTLNGVQMSINHLFLSPVLVVRTNLYHNHAKSKYVCFSCIFIASLKNLRCGPPHSISPYPSDMNRAQPANDRG